MLLYPKVGTWYTLYFGKRQQLDISTLLISIKCVSVSVEYMTKLP